MDAQHSAITNLPAQAGDYELEVVESDAGLQSLRDEWNVLERNDPESTVFLSWNWSRACFSAFPGRWKVVCLRHAGQLVCVAPFKYRIRWSRSRKEFQTEIEPGSRLMFSEYCGFLCAPDHAERVLPELARYLQAQPWVSLTMKYGFSPQRASVFKAAFSDNDYRVREREYRLNSGQTDSLISVRVPLDGGFDAYLKTRLKAKLRGQIRQYTRRYLDSGDMYIVWNEGAQAAESLPLVMAQWRTRWEPLKGPDQTQLVIDTYTRYLHQAAELGLLHVPVLWQGERPLGSLAYVADPVKGRMHCIISGRNETVTGGFIGPLMHGAAIQRACERGDSVYDFCHGDQEYKFRLGGSATRVSYFSIERRDLNRAIGNLDRVCLPNAMGRLTRMISKGDQDQALSASRQIQALMDQTIL